MAPTGLTMKDLSALFHWSGTHGRRHFSKRQSPIMISIRRARSLLALILLPFTCAAVLGQTAHYSGAQFPIPSLAQYATGLAVDKDGNLFAIDQQFGTLMELTASGQKIQVADGLSFPWGLAADNQGNLYITEQSTQGPAHVLIEKVKSTPSGNVYTPTVVPVEGYPAPSPIAVDSQGKIYLANDDQVIVETPAGDSYLQSTLPISTTIEAGALAVDAQGAVYIADMATNGVLKETPSGTGYVASIVAAPLAQPPQSLAVDAIGNVYIDTYQPDSYAEGFFVVKETPSQSGYQQSPFPMSQYANPWSIAVTGNGILYGGGSGGFEKVAPGPAMFTPVDATPFPYQFTGPEVVSLLFIIDTPGNLGQPVLLTQGTAGLDFKDARTGSCTVPNNGPLFHAGDTCSVDVKFYPVAAGPRFGAVVLQDAAQNAVAFGYVSGTGIGAQVAFLPATRSVVESGLAGPSGIAVDALGNLFFSETGNGALYKATRNGESWTLTEIGSGLNHPSAVAIDGRGNLFVAGADTVYQEKPVAAHYVQSEPVAIPGQLNGIAVDSGGNLYLTSAVSGNVHKESLQPDGSYVASAVGFGIAGPAGVAVDGAGNVFITDPRQGEVYEEQLQANGSYRQSVLASDLAEPQGIALDSGGSIYVTSPASGTLYRETLRQDGSWLQTIVIDGLEGPGGIALDTLGNVYVSLDLAEAVDKIDLADPPVLHFARTAVGSTSSDSPQRLTVLSTGNAPPDLNHPQMGNNPALSSGFSLDATTTCPLLDPPAPYDPGEPQDATGSCSYAIDFTPVVAGPTRGSFGIEYVDTATLIFDPTIIKKNVELREAGITSDATRTTVRISPTNVKLGHAIFIEATVSDASYTPIIPQGGNITFTDTVLGKATSLNGGVAVPLTDGKATITIVSSVTGEHTIAAHYGGVNSSFATSTGEAAFSTSK
jgi:sugar lactone lactonase YvrE